MLSFHERIRLFDATLLGPHRSGPQADNALLRAGRQVTVTLSRLKYYFKSVNSVTHIFLAAQFALVHGPIFGKSAFELRGDFFVVAIFVGNQVCKSIMIFWSDLLCARLN